MEKNYLYQEFRPYLECCDDDERNYIEQRLIGQIIWYDKKAVVKQKKYKTFTLIAIILTALIPVLTIFAETGNSSLVTFLIAVFASGSTVFLSVLNLCEYQKLWIQYRSTCEILKSILHRYFMGAREFSSDNKKENLNLLISSCEEYMIKEYETWTQLAHECKKGQ